MWNEALDKARQNKIAVIYPERRTTFSVFTWGGCLPCRDRNDPENYDYSSWPKKRIEKAREKIILPADFRTTADNTDDSSYTYWGEGGFSWAIPYLTGLVVLCWSIDKNLSIQEIYDLIQPTKNITADGRYVVNPGGLIEAVRKEGAGGVMPVSRI